MSRHGTCRWLLRRAWQEHGSTTNTGAEFALHDSGMPPGAGPPPARPPARPPAHLLLVGLDRRQQRGDGCARLARVAGRRHDDNARVAAQHLHQLLQEGQGGGGGGPTGAVGGGSRGERSSGRESRGEKEQECWWAGWAGRRRPAFLTAWVRRALSWQQPGMRLGGSAADGPPRFPGLCRAHPSPAARSAARCPPKPATVTMIIMILGRGRTCGSTDRMSAISVATPALVMPCARVWDRRSEKP